MVYFDGRTLHINDSHGKDTFSRWLKELVFKWNADPKNKWQRIDIKENKEPYQGYASTCPLHTSLQIQLAEFLEKNPFAMQSILGSLKYNSTLKGRVLPQDYDDLVLLWGTIRRGGKKNRKKIKREYNFF